MELLPCTCGSSNVGFVKVSDNYIYLECHDCGRSIAGSISDTQNEDEVKFNLTKEWNELSEKANRIGPSLCDNMRWGLNDIQKSFEAESAENRPQIGTSFKGLDDLGFLIRNKVTVVAANGQDLYAADDLLKKVAVYVASDPEKSVLVFSTSRSAKEYTMEILSMCAQIEYQDLLCGTFEREAWRRLAEWASTVVESRLHVLSRSSLNIEEVSELTHEYAKQQGRRLDLVVIDRLNFIKAAEHDDNSPATAADVLIKLKALAMEFDVPVLTATGVSVSLVAYSDKKRKFKTEQTDKSRYVGFISAYADTVVALTESNNGLGAEIEMKMIKSFSRSRGSYRLSHSDKYLRVDMSQEEVQRQEREAEEARRKAEEAEEERYGMELANELLTKMRPRLDEENVLAQYQGCKDRALLSFASENNRKYDLYGIVFAWLKRYCKERDFDIAGTTQTGLAKEFLGRYDFSGYYDVCKGKLFSRCVNGDPVKNVIDVLFEYVERACSWNREYWGNADEVMYFMDTYSSSNVKVKKMLDWLGKSNVFLREKVKGKGYILKEINSNVLELWKNAGDQLDFVTIQDTIAAVRSGDDAAEQEGR